jgi:phage-related protein
MSWEILYYNVSLQEEILSLRGGLLGRYLQLSDRMLVFGPDLGMPHTRSMGQGLFEMRLMSKEGIARVFFCTVRQHRIVMLHQFVKKTNKTPSTELTTARKRLKEWNDAHP